MSWPMGVVSDIADVISGFAFKSEWFGAGDAKVIRIGDLNNGKIDIGGAETFDNDANQVRGQFKIKSGDILMALSGATVGKIAIADSDSEGAYLNQRVAVIRGKCQENSDYLKYVFSGSPLQKLLLNAGGAAQPNLSPKDLAGMEIPLPPLAEQKRIAAILDKADAIRRKRQQTIQLADDFLRAVFLDMFGDPVTNPKGWEVGALKDVSTIQIGPFGTQLHKEDYIEGGIPLVNPTHIVKGQIVPKSDLTISAEKHAELSEYHLMSGDIVMGRRGEMGRCAVVTKKESGWLCGTGSLFIRPNEAGIFSEYLNKFLSSEAIKSHLESESQGATMPNLNKTIVGSIQVPVPSELALKRFAVIKEKFLATKAVLSKFNGETIFDSISQKAFRGEL